MKGKTCWSILDIINEICYNSDTYKVGDSNEDGKKKIRYIKFRLCLSEILLVSGKTEYEDSLCGGGACSLIAGVILKISAIEWCICMVLFGLVMALEHVNAAVEAVVDMVTKGISPVGESCKGNTAAGAVLIRQLWRQSRGRIFLPKIAQIFTVIV